MKPKLSAIIDALQLQRKSPSLKSMLKAATSPIIQDEYVDMMDKDNEGNPEWMAEVIAEAKNIRPNPDQYVELPSQWDINSCHTMAELTHVTSSKSRQYKNPQAIGARITTTTISTKAAQNALCVNMNH